MNNTSEEDMRVGLNCDSTVIHFFTLDTSNVLLNGNLFLKKTRFTISKYTLHNRYYDTILPPIGSAAVL